MSDREAGDVAGPLAPGDRAGFLVYRAGLAVARGYERALAPVGVSPAEAGVLSMLAYVGPHHVRGLARALGLGRQSVVNVTRRLEEAGLLTRGGSLRDGRLIVLAITDRGREQLAAVEVIAGRFDAQLRLVIGEEGESRLSELLRQVLAAPFLSHED